MINSKFPIDLFDRRIRTLAALFGLIVTIVSVVSGLPIAFPIEVRVLYASIAFALLIGIGHDGLKAWLNLLINENLNSKGSQSGKNGDAITGDDIKLVDNSVAHTYLTKLYGLSYDNLQIQGVVDEHGGLKIWRKSLLVAYDAEIARMDHFLFSEAPNDQKVDVEVNSSDLVRQKIKVELQSGDPGKNLIEEIIKANSNELLMTFTISPSLKAYESLPYTVVETTPPHSVTVSKSELKERVKAGKKRFEYEAFYWEITKPTKHLELKLIIPEKLNPKGENFGVWYGKSRLDHTKEGLRIHNEGRFRKFEKIGEFLHASLDVTYPIPNLIYAITWVPGGDMTTGDS